MNRPRTKAEPRTLHRAGRRRLRTAIAAALLLAPGPPGTAAETQATREYQIKAAFLFNFGQFVTWPSEAFSDATAPFVIGVLGRDPFGETLDAMISGESISGRRAIVERYLDVEEIGSCQILFVSSSETTRLDRIFEALAGRSILTVGEVPGFTDRFGIIRFVIVDNKVRLEVNTAAAEAAKLSISSKLLRLASLVGSGGR